jgi:predicted O-methyltransferase YrrM
VLIRQIVNPAYVVGRIHLAILEKKHPGWPWMSHDAVRFLDGFLRPTDEGIEFGSGRSTTWFGRHTRHLVSIEHNQAWFKIVQQQLLAKGVTNVEYHLIPLDHPEEEPHRKQYDPLPRYVDVINRYDNGHFDFVIVDGHYREACVAAALPKLKVGGILIIDNSNWLTLEQWHIPSQMRILHQSENVRSETTIFLKTVANEESA